MSVAGELHAEPLSVSGKPCPVTLNLPEDGQVCHHVHFLVFEFQ